MIISENQVTVPGRRFRTKISCISTRRLTTIEWLILSCTRKFSGTGERTYRVKDVFEKVFQFQNSELLIKPCLKSLSDLKVINFKTGDTYTYAELRFSDIQLTELGQVMLKDGLLPGEQHDISMDVYYNPLTGKISTSDWQEGKKESGIEMGTESDYDLAFPEGKIIDGLQSGAVASGKFTAAKYRIEGIESLSETDWKANTDIAVDLSENGTIRTIPDILEKNVFSKVAGLLSSREIPDKLLKRLVSYNEIKITSIRGSGTSIKQTVGDICKNSKVLFIHKTIYEAYKKNTTFFKGRIVIIFGDEKSFEIEVKKEKKEVRRTIYLSDEFLVPGVILMNEKEESLSLCRADLRYKEVDIQAPIAVEDTRMQPKLKMVRNWVESVILEHFSDNTAYLALASLPGIRVNTKSIFAELRKKWNEAELDTIVLDAKKLNRACDQLETLPMDLAALSKIWMEKIDYNDPDRSLQQIGDVVAARLISKRSTVYFEIIMSAVEKLRKPQNYSELIVVTQKIGITSYEDALALSDTEHYLYTEGVICDIISAIAKGDNVRIPMLYNWDLFFIDYMNCIRYVEAHIDGLNLFEKTSAGDIKKGISLCPNIGSLQMYFSELLSKNAYLMEQQINVSSVMRNADESRAEAFFENIGIISTELQNLVDAEYNSARARMIKKGSTNRQKVYVLDTCALIHNPKIFLYFSEDEYIRIPTKVIDELGKIKDRRSEKYSPDTSSTARMIARNINEEYLSLFNAKNKIRFLIENADTSLLPDDLDPSVPDNQILSVALKYPECDTTIISDDNVFQLASIAQNISSISVEEFIESHREYYRSLETWKTSVKNRLPIMLPKDNKVEPEAKMGETIETDPIDSLPVRTLMKYATELTNPIMSFLNTNSIKTVGDFRKLTVDSIDGLKAKGAQAVYKNTLKYTIEKMDQIIDKLQKDLDGETGGN